MRVPGLCEKCRRFRYVRLSGRAIATIAASGGVAVGTCADCEAERVGSTSGVRRTNEGRA